MGGLSYGQSSEFKVIESDTSCSPRESGEIIIDLPKSREDMAQKKPTLVSSSEHDCQHGTDDGQRGGSRPLNTLDAGKKRYINSRSTYLAGQRGGQTQPISNGFTTRDRKISSEQPSKRRKLDGSFLDVSATNSALAATARAAQATIVPKTAPTGRTMVDVISLGDSQDGADSSTPQSSVLDDHHNKDSHESLSMGAESHAPGAIATRKPAPQTSPSLNGHNQPHPGPHIQTQFGQALATWTPGSATASSAVSDGEQATNFLAEARRHRKASQDEDDEVQEVQPPRGGRKEQREARHRSNNTTPSRATPQHLHQPPESPDELQQDQHGRHQPIQPLSNQQSWTDTLTPNLSKTKEIPKTISKNIMGNPNSIGLRRSQASSKQEIKVLLESFSLRKIATASLPMMDDFYQVDVYSDGDFCIGPRNPKLVEGSAMLTSSVSRIISIDHTSGRGGLVRLHLRGNSEKHGSSEKHTLALESEKKAYGFVKILQGIDRKLNIIDREEGWMLKVLKNDTAKVMALTERGGQPQSTGSEHEVSKFFKPSKDAPRRPRLTDNLDAPGWSAGQRQQTVITGRDRRGSLSLSPTRSHHTADRIRTTEGNARSTVSRAESTEDFTERSTRARPMRSALRSSRTKEKSSSPKRTKYSESGKLGDPWSRPLVYPPAGKKRETVDFASLPRLDDDEFLNDTLIGFFSRYVQHQGERIHPDRVRNMHFFNSYFFESLTRDGKRKVNHSAVAKWTKNINLFKRDFVIVPINENLHWFLVIICNLPSFARSTEQVDDTNEDANQGSAPLPLATDGPHPDQAEHATRESFEELTLHDHAARSPGRTGKKGNKRKRPSLQKYDPKKPIIISLDSLGQPRSATCGFLKQYLVEEAKTQKIELDSKDIPAMSARAIPTQDNFSDCGLYVCMYLEQFMRDPDRFVRAILQREEFPWPERIESTELRSRLRNLIMNLHRLQENKEIDEPLPELGRIMFDSGHSENLPVSDDQTVPKSPPAPKAAHEARQQLEARMKVKIDTPEKAKNVCPQGTRAHDTGSQRQTRMKPTAPEAIIIEDDPESPSVAKAQKTPPQQSADISHHTDPMQLAQGLRRAREHQTQADDQRHDRADDVSTAFLHQARMHKTSGARNKGDGGAIDDVVFTTQQRQSQVSMEIPETQVAEEELLAVQLQAPSQARAAENEIISL